MSFIGRLGAVGQLYRPAWGCHVLLSLVAINSDVEFRGRRVARRY